MYIVIILLFISSAYAQVELNKTCNFTELITPFNVTTIAGTWYQLQRVENLLETGDCSTSTFTVILSNGIPKGMEFSNREVVSGKILYRNATVSSSETDFGVMNFTFADGDSNNFVILPVPYYGHESMLLYSCQDNGTWSSVWAWKLGRNLIQSPEAKNATAKLVGAIEDLSNATWRTISFAQADCKVNGGGNYHILSPFLMLSISIAAFIVKIEPE